MGLAQLHGWSLILKLGLCHFVCKRNWVWAGDIRRDTEFEKHHTIFEESFFAVFMDYDHQIEGLVPNTQKQFWYPWDGATFGTIIFKFRESRFFPKPRTSWVEKWPKILYLQIPKRWLKNVFWPFFELLSSFLGQPCI